MKKFVLIAVVVSSLLVVLPVFGANVTDDNKGNNGYILVNNGTGTKHQGTWTDPSFLKGDKGDTGERGETGVTGQAGQDGLDGRDGTNGVDGQNGQDGYTPIKGVDYNDGKDGAVGETGSQGATGQDGKTPIKNIDYFDGINGTDGKDVDPKTVNEINDKITNNTNSINNLNNRVDKLEETQTIIGGELRIYDSKKWQINTFADYSTNRNQVDRVGVRFQYKVGLSYEERRLNELEARLNMLQPKANNENIEAVPTTTGFRIKVNN